MAAFKKSIANRLHDICRFSRPSLTSCRISSPSVKTFAPCNKALTDPGDGGISRRFLHRKPVYQSSSEIGANSMLRSFPTGETFMEKMRMMDILKERIRIDAVIPHPQPPAAAAAEEEEEERDDDNRVVTVEDARKLLRLSQMEMVKASIREVGKACVTYDEFLEICEQGGCWSADQAKELAKMLDQSGNVVVLGNVVFLRPEQE